MVITNGNNSGRCRYADPIKPGIFDRNKTRFRIHGRGACIVVRQCRVCRTKRSDPQLPIPRRIVAERIEVQTDKKRIPSIETERKKIDIRRQRQCTGNPPRSRQRLWQHVIRLGFGYRRSRLHLHMEIIRRNNIRRGPWSCRNDAQVMRSRLRERRSSDR